MKMMTILKNARGNDRTVTMSKDITLTKNWRDDPRFGGTAKRTTTYFVEVSYGDKPDLNFYEKHDTLAGAQRFFRTWSKLCDD